ncbi:F-box protein Ecym_8232 [Eremothecium cymbalariae DBVPG|uniref:F-box domain-containing protein n=1 Tax=Eremothecium cymbalariae (strain CBS 270.75 / DBVPG 7215 / KCTC 17166 / NRRL Y-17582) TaxID=931890 RepID=G8JXE3_ERECY|nr:Hypothetical protein Ecym_8232 [Eremothecium cymbalariae DBVPG\
MARYFNLDFCAPIGHAGAPLPALCNWQGGQDRCLGDECRMKSVGKGYERLLELPLEVKIKISRYLSQYDLVNLAGVSRAFHDVAVLCLYGRIVIDPSACAKTVSKQGCNFMPYNEIVIKSRFSLMRFMAVISAKEPLPFGALVRSIKVLDFPAGFTRRDSFSFVRKVLPNLVVLQELCYRVREHWIPDDIYNFIPASTSMISMPLKSIDGSLKRRFRIREFFCKKYIEAKDLHNLMHNLSEISDNLGSSLSTLQLHRDDQHHSLHTRNLNPGQSLIVTQYMIDNNLPQPDFLERDTVVSHNQLDVFFWDFLKYTCKLANLRELDVSGANFKSSDAVLVSNHINLANLETLCFTNVNEVQWLPEVSYYVDDMQWLHDTHLRKGFLPSIALKFVNLKRVKLDYKEPIGRGVPEFLETLASNGVFLSELDLVINWDKSSTVSASWENTAERYADAILMHRCTLVKLSLVAKEESSYYELHKNIPMSSLMRLSSCKNIESLRFYGGSLQTCDCELLEKFPKLVYLDLCGREAGGPLHMGLHTRHDGVLDEWYRVIHVPINLSRRIPTVKFIKINTCLFECRQGGEVLPSLDGLEPWFTAKTRVIVSEK